MSVLKSKMILENISAAISFLINQVLDTSMSSIITITLNGAILIDNAEFFNQNLCILITIAPPFQTPGPSRIFSKSEAVWRKNTVFQCSAHVRKFIKQKTKQAKIKKHANHPSVS